MGQYHRIVNLDKREFINPRELGSGAKAWEQMMNPPAKALIMLISSSNNRGGGDIDAPDEVLGRWAGNRIAMIGDYSEDRDLPPEYNARMIYNLCQTQERLDEFVQSLRKDAEGHTVPLRKAECLYLAEKYAVEKPYKDISGLLREALAKNMGCKWDPEQKAFIPLKD